MRNRSIVLALGLVSGLALASARDAGAIPLDVGVWNGGGCCSDRTRGYWFVAPIDFTITGLSVPGNGDGSNSTLEVLRLANTPPGVPGATNDFVSLGYWAGSPGISANILIWAGDIVGILGWRDGMTPYRDYGDYATTLGGSPIVLVRLGFQDRGPAHDVWQEPPGNIGVIGMDYEIGVPEPATILLLGAGLAGLAGLRRRSER